jgi:tellurite methyltransferase
MATTAFSEWDAKHRAAATRTPPEPANLVRELLPLLPRGPALDLACGTGRHTMLLAERGQGVTAVDGSLVALEILEQRARAANLALSHEQDSTSVAACQQGIRLVRADLENTTLPANSFSLVLCIHYLQRSLFAAIERAIQPGGTLLFETFTTAQMELEGGPKNPEYLLDPGELRVTFPALRVVFYRELRAGQGIASLLAQKPLLAG